MSKPDLYRQCLLERPSDNGATWKYVAWIPIKFGKVGKHIKIKNKDGLWDKWFVREAYSVKDSDFLNIQSSTQQDYEEVLDAPERRNLPKPFSKCNC
jgi:hypothetical protein